MEALQINLRQIEVFRATMKLGTVTAAAAALKSSQPTITRELRRMEDVIGFALFERKKQRIQPTARALKLFHEVEASFVGLDQINYCVNRLREAHGEVLYVTTLPAFALDILPEAVTRLIEALPQVAVEIEATDPRMESPVSGFNFDIGLVEDDFADENAQVIVLGVFEQVCILPKDHPLCSQSVLSPADFCDVSFVSLGAQDPYRLLVDQVFDEAGVVRAMSVTTRSAHSACELVRRGVGVSIVNPLTALGYLGRGVELRPFRPAVRFFVSALRPLNRPKVGAAERLIALLKLICEEKQAQLRQLHLLSPASRKVAHMASGRPDT